VINPPSVAVRRGRLHENQGLLASLDKFVINQPSVAVRRGRPLPRSESLLHENQGLLASLVRFVINPQSVAEKLKNGMEMHILLIREELRRIGRMTSMQNSMLLQQKEKSKDTKNGPTNEMEIRMRSRMRRIRIVKM
jgi:hypothetical protein